MRHEERIMLRGHRYPHVAFYTANLVASHVLGYV